jgi:hypothetical protein
MFMSPETPPKRLVRPKGGATVVYSFGDASGCGFGSSMMIGQEIRYISGQWSEGHDNESSNHRELANLVYALEEAHKEGLLEDTEVFIFTDISTVESAFFKGTSSSQKLFDLVLCLQQLHLHGSIMIHFVHVAGKRMMAQGTDGLSRGVMNEGILAGKDFLSFVPLHLSAIERQRHPLMGWVESWFGALGDFTWLSPKDWYLKGHSEKRCVWTPPPAAADAALEQLAKSIHKRPLHMHLVLIPRLMTAYWRKMLLKNCDLVFTIPIGTDL